MNPIWEQTFVRREFPANRKQRVSVEHRGEKQGEKGLKRPGTTSSHGYFLIANRSGGHEPIRLCGEWRWGVGGGRSRRPGLAVASQRRDHHSNPGAPLPTGACIHVRGKLDTRLGELIFRVRLLGHDDPSLPLTRSLSFLSLCLSLPLPLSLSFSLSLFPSPPLPPPPPPPPHPSLSSSSSPYLPVTPFFDSLCRKHPRALEETCTPWTQSSPRPRLHPAHVLVIAGNSRRRQPSSPHHHPPPPP